MFGISRAEFNHELENHDFKIEKLRKFVYELENARVRDTTSARLWAAELGVERLSEENEDLRAILDALLDHLGIDLEYVEPETKGKYRVVKRDE